MTLRTRVRGILEQRAPGAVSCFRDLRDAVAFYTASVRETPLGFKLGGHRGMQSGEFEPEETQLLQELLAVVDVFVDVGANIGLYSCLARYHSLHTIAIEPMVWNCAQILQNVTANGWDDVEVFPVAVGSVPGIRELYGSGTGASLIRGWAGWPVLHRRKIAVSTLDILLAERFASQRMLIKIDAEGAEHEILRGAESLLSREPAPIWFVEICLDEHHPEGMNRSFAAAFELFQSHSYRCYVADRKRTPVTLDDVDRWQQCGHSEFESHNYLFVKP